MKVEYWILIERVPITLSAQILILIVFITQSPKHVIIVTKKHQPSKHIVSYSISLMKTLFISWHIQAKHLWLKKLKFHPLHKVSHLVRFQLFLNQGRNTKKYKQTLSVKNCCQTLYQGSSSWQRPFRVLTHRLFHWCSTQPEPWFAQQEFEQHWKGKHNV
jgi:hypothetical protein